jgi:LytS/YehU family sensor histidine kinase
LDIEVISQDKKIAIIIKDNGIGRKRSSELKTMGTGKGLHIVTTIVESYNKLYNRSVSYEINDLIDEKGVGIGTEVRVLV